MIPRHAKIFALPGLEKKLKPQKKEGVELTPPPKTQLASEANFTIESVIPIRTPGQRFKLIHGLGKIRARKLHFAPPEGFDLSKLPIRGERRFEISEELKRQFTKNTDALFREDLPKTAKPQVILPKRSIKTAPLPVKKPSPIPKQRRQTARAAGVMFKKQEKGVMDQKITTGAKNARPQIPTQNLKHAQIVPLTTAPNVVSGIVTGGEDNPLEKVILTIKDQSGIPVRALKTNRLGQFLSATPLSNGTYTIEIESDSHRFKNITLNLTGKVLEPLEIKGGNGQT